MNRAALVARSVAAVMIAGFASMVAPLSAAQRGMEAKGLLSRVPNESPVRFRAVQEEKRLLPPLVGRFVERILGGSPGPLLAYFADSGKLSEKDLKVLRAMAEKIAKTPEQP